MKNLLEKLNINPDAAAEILGEVERMTAERENALDELRRESDAALEALRSELQDSSSERENALSRELDELRNTVSRYETENAERAATAAANERFERVCGGSRFVNSLTRDGIFREFRTAIESTDNASLSDSDLYASITASHPDIFAAETPVPTVVSTTAGNTAFQLTENDVREIMGL